MSEIDLLQEQIAEKSREISSDGYSVSIGELMSMYRDGDIDLHPEFQRIFRWTVRQKSSLVESILLGIPIPSIFVSQREDGIWDVVDGVQRLSTIMEYVGIYVDENGVTAPPLSPKSTVYLPSLSGRVWDLDDPNSIGPILQRYFKRAKIEVKIIMKESDPDAKFDLFERLNSGTQLSDQEARNCLLVMLSPEVFEKLNSLSLNDAFCAVTTISERKESEAFRSELVLRFFAQCEFDGPETDLKTDFGEYLTDWMRAAARREGLGQRVFDSDLFQRVFRLLEAFGGSDVFRRYDAKTDRHVGPFSNAAFEFVASGLASSVSYWESETEALSVKLKEYWDYPDFFENKGAGVSSRTRFPRLVPAGRRYFSPPSS